jgi:hypothetical protein
VILDRIFSSNNANNRARRLEDAGGRIDGILEDQMPERRLYYGIITRLLSELERRPVPLEAQTYNDPPPITVLTREEVAERHAIAALMNRLAKYNGGIPVKQIALEEARPLNHLLVRPRGNARRSSL